MCQLGKCLYVLTKFDPPIWAFINFTVRARYYFAICARARLPLIPPHMRFFRPLYTLYGCFNMCVSIAASEPIPNRQQLIMRYRYTKQTASAVKKLSTEAFSSQVEKWRTGKGVTYNIHTHAGSFSFTSLHIRNMVGPRPTIASWAGKESFQSKLWSANNTSRIVFYYPMSQPLGLCFVTLREYVKKEKYWSHGTAHQETRQRYPIKTAAKEPSCGISCDCK